MSRILNLFSKISHFGFVVWLDVFGDGLSESQRWPEDLGLVVIPSAIGWKWQRFCSDTDQKALQLLQAFEADQRFRMVASLLEDEGEVALDKFASR